METDTTLPFYWVVPRRVAAGPYPGSPDPAGCESKLRGLLDHGVRSFVDLTEPGEVSRLGPLVPYDDTLARMAGATGAAATYRRFAVPDLSVPTPLTMLQILDHLDAEVATGRPVYVHCLGGKGRTGTVVGCTLLRHARRLLPRVEPASPQIALEQIVRLRATQGVPAPWDSPQTVCQFEFVRAWEAGV
ncbi:MAG: tyrosine-protein phosphatase [Deferrisomatales bacterium]|nr:tyrosine-protein phosphatase [Deferrisomatales bacterium]